MVVTLFIPTSLSIPHNTIRFYNSHTHRSCFFISREWIAYFESSAPLSTSKHSWLFLDLFILWPVQLCSEKYLHSGELPYLAPLLKFFVLFY